MTPLRTHMDDSGIYVDGFLVGARPEAISRQHWIDLADNLNAADDIGNDITSLTDTESEVGLCILLCLGEALVRRLTLLPRDLAEARPVAPEPVVRLAAVDVVVIAPGVRPGYQPQLRARRHLDALQKTGVMLAKEREQDRSLRR